MHCLWSPEGIRSPGTEVTGDYDCELPRVCVGMEFRPLEEQEVLLITELISLHLKL